MCVCGYAAVRVGWRWLFSLGERLVIVNQIRKEFAGLDAE
jgi:hypothetical protein